MFSFLKGPDGKVSSMRVTTIFVVFSVMFVWSFLSIKNNAIQDLPESITIMVLSIVGVKAGQFVFGENKGGKKNENGM